MKVVELFSGTESFSKAARELGHETFTVDNDSSFNPDLLADAENLRIGDFPWFMPDIIWASPPCESFSVATIGKNWVDWRPSEKALMGIRLVTKTLELIMGLRPTFYFIENPRGMLRSLRIMSDLPKRTVTYCQYGETRMKPTDIWTNCDVWESRPPCNNGDPCHESAPRGARMGTQGIKGARDRAIVPRELCLEILEDIDGKRLF